MEWLKVFYNDNQTLINIVGLIASVLTIIAFFKKSKRNNKNMKINDSFKNINNSNINIRQ